MGGSFGEATARVDGSGTGVVVSLLGLVGGVAIMANAYWNASVWLTLLSYGGPLVAVLVVAWSATPVEVQNRIRERVWVGVVAGVIGVVAYDLARWSIVVIGGLDVNPFEALPVFGELLVGSRSGASARWVAGAIYHLANGIGFAVFFAVLVGRRGVLAGIAWALVLEVAMLAVYPGWLDIRARNEFTAVSLAGHVAYGAAIGQTTRRRLDATGSVSG